VVYCQQEVNTYVNTAPTQSKRNRRGTEKFLEVLRSQIRSGSIQSGTYLPTVRQLSAEHAISCKTIHRAMQVLVGEGLVTAEPRQGYRVKQGAGSPEYGCPLAYVPDDLGNVTFDAPFRSHLMIMLREAASHRGWSMLTAGTEKVTGPQLVEGMKTQNSFGAVLNTIDPTILDEVERWGAPAVVVNEFAARDRIDSVVQDGQQGGQLAVEYLLARGCRNIVWLGPLVDDVHSHDRLGGAVSTLVHAGRPVSSKTVVSCPNQEQEKIVRALLARKDRPDGIVALWRGPAVTLAAVAREKGIELGRDLHAVGWCPEEIYNSSYLPSFSGGAVPPAIVWSVKAMAEIALSRLAERRRSPEVTALRVKVPVTLRVAEREA
jgi:DNA-binding LacI/PurR family transcriptional regulator